MDARKIGSLIKQLRTTNNLTQLALSEKLHVSDRAVSKWERGEGCPDITLITHIAATFGVSIESILTGTLQENEKNGGNMKRIPWYRCPVCGNIISTTGSAAIVCCGHTLEALVPHQADAAHTITVRESDGEQYITFSHEMEKDHFITFIAYVAPDRVFTVRLYPEQGGEVCIPRMQGGIFYICCSRDGLFTLHP
jgi:DNA-binding XRE family transcriptional regulator